MEPESSQKPPAPFERHRGARLSQHLDTATQLEVLQLRDKLHEMTELVQQLLHQMDQLERLPGQGFKEESGSQMGSTVTQTVPEEDGTSQDKSFPFKERLRQLVDMNANWQKYSRLQQQHILELNNKVEMLSQQLRTAEAQQRTDGHRLQQLQEETSRLRDRVAELKSDPGVASSNLGNSTPGRLPAELAGVDSGIVQALEAQVMTYKEDFQMERQDREKAQAKVVQLEAELMELQRRMVTSHGRNQPNLSSTATDGHHSREKSEHHHNVAHKPFKEPCMGNDAEDAGNSCRHNPAAPPLQSGNYSPTHRPTVGERRPVGSRDPAHGGTDFILTRTDDTLRCTNCSKVFQRNEHLELLAHVGKCHSP